MEETKYNSEDLQEFKLLIDTKLEAARKELSFLQGSMDDITTKLPSEKTNDDFDKVEKLMRQLQSTHLLIRNLELALNRIEDQTYGICSSTCQLIPKEELLANPIARMVGEVSEQPVRACRVCGCTDNNCMQCIEKTGGPCHWVEEDLCSACQMLENVNVTQTQQLSNHKSINMSFFKQLSAQTKGCKKLTIVVMPAGDKLQVGFLPETSSDDVNGKLKMLSLNGTPEELDQEFFDHVKRQVQTATGVQSNIEEVEKSVKDLEAEKKAEAEKKKADKPAPAAKPATSKQKAKPAAKTPAKKKEVKAVKPAPKKAAKPAKPKKEAKVEQPVDKHHQADLDEAVVAEDTAPQGPVEKQESLF